MNRFFFIFQILQKQIPFLLLINLPLKKLDYIIIAQCGHFHRSLHMNKNDVWYPAQCLTVITKKNKTQSQRERDPQPSAQLWGAQTLS